MNNKDRESCYSETVSILSIKDTFDLVVTTIDARDKYNPVTILLTKVISCRNFN